MSVSTSHLATDATVPTDTIHLAADGTGRAEFSDTEVPIEVTRSTMEDARRELLTLCVETAQRRGNAIRVAADENGVISHLRVSPGGSITPLDEDSSSRPSAFGRRPTRGEARAQRARPAPSQPPTRSIHGPAAVTAAEKPSATGSARPAWVPVAAIIAAGMIVVAAVVFAFSTFFGGGGDADQNSNEPVAVQARVPLPQNPPLEWRQEAIWASPALLPEAQKVAVIDGDAVGMVTADRRAALVGADGQTKWTVALPEGQVRSPLSLTYVDDARVLAIHVGSRLVWWGVDDPAVTGGVDLPGEETPVTWRGDTPLVGLGQDKVGVVQDGQLATVTVPQGAKAVSGWADGHVVAGSSTGWWRLTPGAAPGEATPWETPEDKPDQLTVIDGMGAYLVAVRPVGDQVHVVVHVDDGNKITRLMSDVLPGVRAGEALTWRPSSSRSWGILGHAIVDMERASVTDLGTPWTTEHIIADRAMGTLGREKVIVSPDAPRGVMQPGESFPEEVLGTNALVRGRDEQGERVWLLPPNPDVATVQPSSRPTGG